MGLLKFADSYKSTTCILCGVVIVMPEDFYNCRLKDQKHFYCINGHSQFFKRGQTEADKLRKELEAAEAEAEYQKRRAMRAYEAQRKEERRTAAYKGQVTKIKNRVGKGVCPCCNRSFVNLARHMANQHPNFEGYEEPTDG